MPPTAQAVQNSSATRASGVHEGELLARYILGCATSPAILQRYARACDTLFGRACPKEEAVVRFVHRNPWALPFLDAVTAMLAPRCLLRGKVLLMLAVLEATPDHVRTFSPATGSRLRSLARLAGWAAAGLSKFLVGLALYPVATSGRP